MYNRDIRFLGEIIKFQITWEYPADKSITLDSDKVSYSIEYYANNKATIHQSEVHAEEGPFGTEHFIYVDTSFCGFGDLWLKIIVHISDTNAPRGEVIQINAHDTKITIV